MYNEINLDSIKIVYAGKDFGNMDLRFGDPKAILNRQNKLEILFPDSKFIQMGASGGDGLIDLSEINHRTNWEIIKCDALITNDPKSSLALFPADCIPIVIYSKKTSNIALIHVGHKGAEIGLPSKVLNYLKIQKQEQLCDLRIYIGFGISQNSYSFPDINSHQKHSQDWKPFISYHDRKYFIDLKGFIINQLIHDGVTREHITSDDIDTFDKTYFSHRRSVLTGEQEGRNLFAVGYS